MTAPIDYLIAEIRSLGSAVGFSEPGPDHPLYGADLPEDVHAFASRYAWLLVWPVAEASGPALLKADRMAEEYFAEAFPPDAGQIGHVIDGYVVFALASRPTVALPEARQVRLKRTICRRAVVWYDEPEQTWQGVESITVLDVPGLGGGKGLRRLPNLSADQAALLEVIAADGKTAATVHIGEITS